MTVTRRRFIAITATALGLPGAARAGPYRWRGRALGADAFISLHGSASAKAALAAALARLRGIEATFSLHDPASELSRMNRDGVARRPSGDLRALCEIAGRAHAATGGLFDPSIQTLWRDLAAGRPPRHHLAGWQRVTHDGGAIRLGRGQALSFNGIAQGYATDAVTEILARHGFGETLVSIGEFRAGPGNDHAIGIADPAHGLVGRITLADGAVATSSPAALFVQPRQSHILDPTGRRQPRWSTVTVEAATATWADALSTAFCLMTRAEIENATARLDQARRVVVVTAEGNLRTIGRVSAR